MLTPSCIGACRVCQGTQARLGYAAFDVQLWKGIFVTTLYAVCTSVRA